MIKTHIKSWFEIWAEDYINDADDRLVQDRDLIILQIEHCTHTDYLVELIKPDDYKQPLFSMGGRVDK